jgi:L-ascorbate metabolism protein UlaG (beta-lactamase superfamily)
MSLEIQFIRNATLRVAYAGHRFVIDPYLAPKHSLPSYTGRSLNPLVDLPIPPAAVIADAEFVLISHLHSDHFDTVAQKMLPAHTPILCQPGDETRIQAMGFTHIQPVADEIRWANLSIRPTGGRHGSSPGVLQAMGPVSGFVLRAEGEPTIYWAGDTVLTDEVRAVLAQERPDIVVIHAGGAVWKDAAGEDECIIMDAGQAVAVCNAVPAATIIATHLEALDHCLSSRADLRAAAQAAGIPDERLRIPGDGAVIEGGL